MQQAPQINLNQLTAEFARRSGSNADPDLANRHETGVQYDSVKALEKLCKCGAQAWLEAAELPVSTFWRVPTGRYSIRGAMLLQARGRVL